MNNVAVHTDYATAVAALSSKTNIGDEKTKQKYTYVIGYINSAGTHVVLYDDKKKSDQKDEKKDEKLEKEKKDTLDLHLGKGSFFKSNEIAEEGDNFVKNVLPAFLKALPPDQPRFAAIDVFFQTKDGNWSSKIVFIRWSPEKSGVKHKMSYSSAEGAVKGKLNFSKTHQATDESELTHTVLSGV